MISLKLQKLKYSYIYIYIYIYIVAHSLNCFFNLCLGIWCGWNLGRRLLISSHYFKRCHRYNIRCKIKHINHTRESYNKACIDHYHLLLIHVQIYRNLTFLSLMKANLHYRCQNENQTRTNETLATFVKRSESKCIQQDSKQYHKIKAILQVIKRSLHNETIKECAQTFVFALRYTWFSISLGFFIITFGLPDFFTASSLKRKYEAKHVGEKNTFKTPK